MYDKLPKTVCTKPEMLFDASPMWERPIVLDTINWSTSDARFSILKSYSLMYDLFNATPSFRSFMKNYAYFRCHACAYVTVTGTINHQGTILASCTPYDYYYFTAQSVNMVNTFLTSPHAILGANEASSTCIEIPFYVSTDFLTMEATTGSEETIPDLGITGKNPYCELNFMVLNPLAVSGSSSNTISIHTQIKINKLELYVQTPSAPVFVTPPTLAAVKELEEESMLGRFATRTIDNVASVVKQTSSDFIDSLRSVVRTYTGLHNPNQPAYEHSSFMQTRNRTNLVDVPTFYEKMDPYSNFTRITKDEIFNTHVDEMDMNFILSKPQYLGTFQVSNSSTVGTLLWCKPISPWQGGFRGGQGLCNNIERLYYNSQAWSGDMELIIQSSMTNKQNLKLLVSKLYGLDKSILSRVPTYDTAKTGLTSLLEFSAGNQQLVVDLDFLSRNQVLYNTVDPNANALMHGMYYIYLAQPLVVADSVPTTVEFNVFLRCKKNFRYYGYAYRPGFSTFRNTPYIPFPALVAESAQAPVMNDPSTGAELNNRDVESVTQPLNEVERMYPISHLRDLVRRVQYSGRYTASADADGVYVSIIPVTSLIGQFPSDATDQSPNQNLLKMYYSLNVGLRVKIRSFDSANHTVQYYPPTMTSGYSATPATTAGFTTSVIAPTSPFINLVRGPISGCPILEAPTTWLADIKAAESGSVMELHIPHTTMYKWWGGGGWSTQSGPGFSNYSTLLNNMGYIMINGIAAPNSTVDFEVFAGLDDESRLGYHTASPVLWLPMNPDKLSYALPERITTGSTSSPIGLVQSKSLYYTNLNTAFNTAL